METGRPRGIYANVKNTGLIGDLPDGCCVEVPCLVDRAGVQPTAVGVRPPQLAAINRTFLNVVELTVRAVLDGDRTHAYEAAMLDPNASATLSLDQIHDLMDDLIEAHGELIPEPIRRGSTARRR
jgi:alpha-galactosidase